MEITYGIYRSPFAWCVIAVTERRVCSIAFIKSKSAEEGAKRIRAHWPEAKLIRDDGAIASYAKNIFKHKNARPPIDLLMQGTNFQMNVWSALLAIPEGKTKSYADIARAIHAPKAVRAVGNACRENAIPFLIPCHRVLTAAGDIGGYSGGIELKRKILAWEGAATKK